MCDLRETLREVAEFDKPDRQIVLNLTKTIETLTAERVHERKQWDPSFGEADIGDFQTRREALVRKLQYPESKHRKTRKERIKKEGKGRISLVGLLQSLRKRLGWTSTKDAETRKGYR